MHYKKNDRYWTISKLALNDEVAQHLIEDLPYYRILVENDILSAKPLYEVSLDLIIYLLYYDGKTSFMLGRPPIADLITDTERDFADNRISSNYYIYNDDFEYIILSKPLLGSIKV